MNRIHRLTPQLIAQIAAGEVIEQPSYAVKELLDNAIDANASEITISLENSGLKKITIIDNGDGMSKDDLFESYKIHTTSKLNSEDELSAIKSMGFRGEALASIASISKIEIKSRTKDEITGYSIEVLNGKLIKDSPVGMAKGTIIEISNIFSSVPARKKFLKSPSAELRNSIDVFLSFALMFPQIRFILFHNKKKLFDLPKTNHLFTRISLVLNETITQKLLPISNEDPYINIQGYIAKPEITTQSSTKQFLFVNNRRITDKVISQAVKSEYMSLIPDRQQPIFLLFIKVPHELVDVNVHPRKEQVAFHNIDMICEQVSKAVKYTLENNNLNFGNTNDYQSITNSTTGNILKDNTKPWQVKDGQLKINYKTIRQIHDLFLTVETKYGQLIVDQHAAHERILFEQFRTEFENQKIKTVTLKNPIKISLTLQEKILIKEFEKELLYIGFFINTEQSKIVQIPEIFQDRNIQQLIKELLESIENKNITATIDTVSLKIIQFLACKNAIKAGDKLTESEAVKLIKKLEQTKNNYTCPHGRPTKHILSLRELNKLFKRF